MEDKLFERIEVNPKVMVGKPVIKGTRIPVDLIVRLVAKGIKTEEILEDYPQISEEDIKAALWYASEIISGEAIVPLVRYKKNVKAISR